jgi:hypothetical protein
MRVSKQEIEALKNFVSGDIGDIDEDRNAADVARKWIPKLLEHIDAVDPWLNKSEIHIFLLALAVLSLQRPGWYEGCIKTLVLKLDFEDGFKLFECFREHNKDVVKPIV